MPGRSGFVEPRPMGDVDAALRARVEASREEVREDRAWAAVVGGEVPGVVVPTEVLSVADARQAVMAALNARG